MSQKKFYISVDVGGTFTDTVILDGETGELSIVKNLSTPNDFSEGILSCMDEGRVDLAGVDLIKHGSTVAINTLLERTGADVAVIATAGFRDVLELRRGNRPNGFDLKFRALPPLAERRNRYEVEERTDGAGRVVVPLDEEGISQIRDAIKRSGVEAVAVALINSYKNPEHESRIGELIGDPDLFVTLSHEVSGEWREYERTSTAVVNSYVGPRVSRYIDGLERRLRERNFRGSLLIMQSNGGVISAKAARARPVQLIESGPVAGVIGAAQIAKQMDLPKLLAFDMGGTTAKCSMIENAIPAISSLYWVEGYARGYPVQTPVVDIIEVGAGGGSIAWLDEVGSLKVGPRSAGAMPGPVCYGRGGTEPTVTDANLVLGYLNPSYFLGGKLPLQVDAAKEAIGRLGKQLGTDVNRTAAGIIRLANALMTSTVRRMTVEKGYDPHDFAFAAYGGAGALHACAIASELGIGKVIIPPLPGLFSAWGMLISDLRLDRSETFVVNLDAIDRRAIAGRYDALAASALEELHQQGVAHASVATRRHADMRYVGQEHTLLVPVTADNAGFETHVLRKAFEAAYLQRFGHIDAAASIEIVSIRVAVEASISKPGKVDRKTGSAHRVLTRNVYFEDMNRFVPVNVYKREGLPPDAILEGPCIVEEETSATVVPAGATVTLSPSGNLIVDLKK